HRRRRLQPDCARSVVAVVRRSEATRHGARHEAALYRAIPALSAARLQACRLRGKREIFTCVSYSWASATAGRVNTMPLGFMGCSSAMPLYALKPRFQGLLRPLVARLAAGGVTANQVTVAAAVGSLVVAAIVICAAGHFAAFLLLPLWLL